MCYNEQILVSFDAMPETPSSETVNVQQRLDAKGAELRESLEGRVDGLDEQISEADQRQEQLVYKAMGEATKLSNNLERRDLVAELLEQLRAQGGETPPAIEAGIGEVADTPAPQAVPPAEGAPGAGDGGSVELADQGSITEVELRELFAHINSEIQNEIEALRAETQNLPESRMLDIEGMSPGTLFALYATQETGEDGQAWNTVNFEGNNRSEKSIGLGDMLGNDVQYVVVEKEGERQVGYRTEIQTRNGGTRIGYKDATTGDYLEVLGGYRFRAATREEFDEYSSTNWAAHGNSDTYEAGAHTAIAADAEGAIHTQWREGMRTRERTQAANFEQLMADYPELAELVESRDAEGMARAFEAMEPSEILSIRRHYGANGFADIMKQAGMDQLNRKSQLDAGLVSFFNGEVDPRFNAMIAAAGGKRAMASLLAQLSSHETAGDYSTVRPFNASHTGPWGYFHWNGQNMAAYGVNPCNPESAIRGEMELLLDGFRSLGSIDKAVGAHNAGIGGVRRNWGHDSGNARNADQRPRSFANAVMGRGVDTSFASQITE